jgi:hypothetical protein
LEIAKAKNGFVDFKGLTVIGVVSTSLFHGFSSRKLLEIRSDFQFPNTLLARLYPIGSWVNW